MRRLSTIKNECPRPGHGPGNGEEEIVKKRTRTNITGVMLTLLILTLGLTGCASQQAGVKKSPDTAHTGFLSDYSKLEPTGQGVERYQDPDMDFSRYDKILLDRITVWYKNDNEYKGIDPAELKALADYFHTAIVAALGDAYPVVDTPGPDVLRVRIALTDLVPTKPEYSVVMLAVPFGSAADLVMGGKDMHAPYLGETAVEAEMLDSLTHQQLYAYIERKQGKKYQYDPSKGTEGVKAGVSGYFDAYSTWGYAKAACDQWAKALRVRLDKMHGTAN